MKTNPLNLFFCGLGVVAVYFLWAEKEYMLSIMSVFIVTSYWRTVKKPEMEFFSYSKNCDIILVRVLIVVLLLTSQIKIIFEYFQIE